MLGDLIDRTAISPNQYNFMLKPETPVIEIR